VRQLAYSSEDAKIEIGDTITFIVDAMENGDLFLIYFCNRPLHRCQETFQDEWGNTWYEGDMIIGGTWYQKMPNQQGTNIPYNSSDFGPTFVYFVRWLFVLLFSVLQGDYSRR
jgi:hypothetical protein